MAPNFLALISAYGTPFVAGMIAIESMGLPIPGETVLIAGAIYAGTTHELQITAVIGASIVGAVLGTTISFAIGRAYGEVLLRRYGGYIHLDESRIRIGQYLFLRHGAKVVFVARFVPLLRSVVGLLAGANRMPWSKFMTANVAGAVAWAGFDALAAYFFGEAITNIAAPVGVALSIAAVAIIILLARFVARHERELAAEAEHALRHRPRG